MAQEGDRIIDWRQKSDEAYALVDRLRCWPEGVDAGHRARLRGSCGAPDHGL